MSDRVADLARKYRTMLALREAHERGEGVAERHVLRALAKEFPSALREIDRLPMHALRDRARRTEAAASNPAQTEDWMVWLGHWHSLLAATLATRLALGADRSVPYDRALALAERVRERSGVAVDTDYIARVAAPPGGRLVTVVLERLASHFDVTPAALREALFPPIAPPMTSV